MKMIDKNNQSEKNDRKDPVEMIDFDSRGLAPAIVQDIRTGDVLMLAYMNEESLRRTIEDGRAHFFSRSRQKLWLKGETSENYQYVQRIKYDCDADALLLEAIPAGPACHTGEETCFYRELSETSHHFDEKSGRNRLDYSILDELREIITSRDEKRPDGSYTVELLEAGDEEMAKKLGEEGVELALSAVQNEEEEIYRESADLIYHLLVMLNSQGLSLAGVLSELRERFRQ
nr:bifunctional phosphoribosyl-AMP cyclohydrolase/phosphoribosyl-ATP diphosphatase HisIE [Halarsenatibacter silvermanii]